MRRRVVAWMVALFVPGLTFLSGSPVSAQMGPGMMGGGQASAMPMQPMAEVVRQVADRLALGKPLEAEKAKRLRRLADQLVAATGRMSGSMGGGMMGSGMMGGGMGQASQEMAEFSRILSQISELVRGQ